VLTNDEVCLLLAKLESNLMANVPPRRPPVGRALRR
jgi:hypothetical protein